MKRFFCILASFVIIATSASADEGMWLLPLLQKLNIKTMNQMGCKLTAQQIYDINNASLKDAIVQFGGGCTGEVISDEGLLVTNHHCGYSSIQKLSTPEHNYLENGYWAMTRDKELPVDGLSVTFLQSMTDITPILDKAGETVAKDNKKLENVDEIVSAARKAAEDALVEQFKKDNPNCEVDVVPFYNDNVYYLVVYKIYKDVRFVGTPPASVGKFGGETDNWMWPRHTGDFSMFRIYAGPDNEPAEYSADNKPYNPKNHLKISLKGINEGDFSMIMGYPGRTQRFQTADQLQMMMDNHDISIAARTVRQDIMWKQMEADPAVRLQYASKYAGSANGWKKWIGEKKAFNDLDIIPREEQKEAAYTKWINSSKKREQAYGGALDTIRCGVNQESAPMKAYTLLGESVGRIELLNFANQLVGMSKRSVTKEKIDTVAALTKSAGEMEASFKDYYEPLDREEAVALLKLYRTNADPKNYLKDFGTGNFNGADFETMDIEAYVADLFNSTAFTSAEKVKELAAKGMDAVNSDPAMALVRSIRKIASNLSGDFPEADHLIAKGSKAYTAGRLQWEKNESHYPDANFTMRLTYGQVLSYSPKDAVQYKYYTTLDGVMEKENPDNYEFIVPAKLKALYQAKDFGQYAMSNGKMPVCFLTNCDITGGNSGSPVLNGNGELIGLAFDGNWESMSSDVMFEPKLQRCICVDIRYVLFLIDKLGGAGYLTKEMDLVK